MIGGGATMNYFQFYYDNREKSIRIGIAETSIVTNSIVLRHYASGVRGMKWQEFAGQWFYAKDPWDSTSYWTVEQMINWTDHSDPTIAPQIDAFIASMRILEQWLTPGTPSYHLPRTNIYEMELEDDFCNHEIPEAERDCRSGEIVTYGDAGQIKLTLFTKPDYYEGTPYTAVYNSGFNTPIFDNSASSLIDPWTGNPGAWNSSDPPLIGLWSMKVDMVQESDHDYGQSVDCVIIGVRNPPRSESETNNVRFAIVSANVFEGAAIPPDVDTGDNKDKVTPYGWTSGWDFTSPDQVPHAPTGHSFTNRWEHGLRLYYINDKQMSALLSALWSNEIIEAVKDSVLGNGGYQRGIISIHKVPVTVSTGSTSPLSILGKPFSDNIQLATLTQTSNDIVQWTTDEMPIPEQFTSFADFNNATMYVNMPFIGKVPIDIKSCRMGSMYVNYFIDVLTGNCIGQIYAKAVPKGSAWVRIYQGSGNCALYIPWIGNTEGMFKQLGAVAGIAGGLSASIATGSPIPLIMSGATSVLNGGGTLINGSGASTADVHYVASEASNMMDLCVDATISGDIPCLSDNQQSVQGFAASTSAKVKDFNNTGIVAGLCITTVNNATAAENDEIKRLIEGGIIV